MSRKRRRPKDHEKGRLYVQLDVVCDACGDGLGSFVQHRSEHLPGLPPHSEEGQVTLAPGSRSWDNRATPEGRKIAASCRSCGAKPQARLDRIEAACWDLDPRSADTFRGSLAI